MLHQTVISSLFPFNPSSSSFPATPSLLRSPSLPPHPSSSLYFPCSQVEKETEMEHSGKGLKTCFSPEMFSTSTQNHPQGFLADDVAFAVELNSRLGEEFSVDELLDFGEFMEPELEEEEEEEAEAESLEEENTNSSSSVLSFDPPPSTEITVPVDDIAELEWVSRFVDDSFSEFPPASGVSTYHPAVQTQTHAQTEPPAGSHQTKSLKRTGCDLHIESFVLPKAKRTKRSRPGRVWLLSGPPPPSTTSSPTTSSSSSSSCLTDDNPAGTGPKKRGRKPKTPSPGGSGGDERRCSHCGVQKTPQWRTGPLGAKTLCNACGVRFKSGRLLPEYRPACSPTFLNHVHSNSHRKVLEMRRKKEVIPSSPSPVQSF